jgi:SHS2 domain-containing protein
MRYEVLEHTADVMIRTTGASLEECFANAAYALFDQMVDADRIEPVTVREITAEGFDLESLLLNFLSEFLFLLDTERLVFGRFDVSIDGLSFTVWPMASESTWKGMAPRKKLRPSPTI